MTAMKLSDYAEAEATDALILSVFKNALTDCVRERHGFPRPRKWLDDLGELGKKLFKVICLQGRKRSELDAWVSEQAKKLGRVPGDAPSIEAAQAMAVSIFDQMQEVQECSPWHRQMARESSDDEDSVSPFAGLGSDQLQPEDEVAFDQMRHFIESLVGAAEISGEVDRQRMHQLAEESWSELGLDDHDRLVLNAYLGRGLGVLCDSEREPTEREIAEDLGLSVPQIRSRRKKVLAVMLDIFPL